MECTVMCALEAAFNMTMGKISKQPLSLGPRGLQGWSVEGSSQEHRISLWKAKERDLP